LRASRQALDFLNPPIDGDRPFRLSQMYRRLEHSAPGRGDDAFADVSWQVEDVDDLLIARDFMGRRAEYVVGDSDLGRMDERFPIETESMSLPALRLELGGDGFIFLFALVLADEFVEDSVKRVQIVVAGGDHRLSQSILERLASRRVERPHFLFDVIGAEDQGR